MDKRIVITDYQAQILTAVYEEDVLMELLVEPKEQQVTVGDIYIGKVKHLVPNIQAAFVEILPGIIGYYAYNDNTRHWFVSQKKNEKLVAGDEIVVQIEKENIKTKAWTLTSKLSFPGRYTVLKAGKEHVIQLSAKIHDELERERLKNIVAEEAGEEFSWIVRTEAAFCKKEDIISEMCILKQYCASVLEIAARRTCYSRLVQGDRVFLSTIKQHMAGNHLVVTTDIQQVFDSIRQCMDTLESMNRFELRLYDDVSYSLLKLKGLEAQIEKALQKKVWMKSGAYLVIEPTETLTVIDVNTGKAIGKQQMEDNFMRINMEAAKEVCRQLRLRNLSGMIIVDFINMKSQDNIKVLFQFLKEEASKDFIQTTVVDRTALHLTEMTRKKVRKPLHEQLFFDRNKVK